MLANVRIVGCRHLTIVRAIPGNMRWQSPILTTRTTRAGSNSPSWNHPIYTQREPAQPLRKSRAHATTIVWGQQLTTRAPLASTLIGASVDTALFFTIAFSGALAFLEPGNDVSWAGEMLPMLGSGPVAPLWVSLAVADWMVKISLALLALIPFRLIVLRFREKVVLT